MKKWRKFETHDYMDMYPEISYRLMTGDEITDFINRMSQYCSGTIRCLGYANKAEILKYIEGLELDELTIANINNNEYYK